MFKHPYTNINLAKVFLPLWHHQKEMNKGVKNMHECMSDYAGGTSGTTEASLAKKVEVGTSSGTGGGECCDGGGVGA